MAHTPGPWEYTRLEADGVVIKRGGNFIIATPEYDVATWIDRAGPIRNEDDAALIAAAPELLEACQTAFLSLNLLHEIYRGEGRPKPNLDRTWQIAAMASLHTHDAIAKAERKQEPT